MLRRVLIYHLGDVEKIVPFLVPCEIIGGLRTCYLHHSTQRGNPSLGVKMFFEELVTQFCVSRNRGPMTPSSMQLCNEILGSLIESWHASSFAVVELSNQSAGMASLMPNFAVAFFVDVGMLKA
jgi:hypothetical protein